MFMLFYFDPRQNYDVMMHALFEYRFLVWYSSHGSNSGIISGSGLPVKIKSIVSIQPRWLSSLITMIFITDMIQVR